VAKHIVKPQHGNQGVRFVGLGTKDGKPKVWRTTSLEDTIALGAPKDQITYYTGQRGQHPHVIRVYQDRSKVKKDELCVRIEWIISGATAVQRTIGSVKDLIDFDHQAFWSKRLSFYHLDIDKLGRMVLNKQNGTNRRNKIIRHGAFTYDVDRRLGQTIMHTCGRTVQGVIDHYYNLITISSCIFKLSSFNDVSVNV
jgi:hypothetical protein